MEHDEPRIESLKKKKSHLESLISRKTTKEAENLVKGSGSWMMESLNTCLLRVKMTDERRK